jgi:hypothetical protein
MFGIGKERLLKSLEEIRKQLCCYNMQPCDCKYIDNEKEFNKMTGGEDTGCCEITEAIRLIKNLTDEEFNNLCIKSKVII